MSSYSREHVEAVKLKIALACPEVRLQESSFGYELTVFWPEQHMTPIVVLRPDWRDQTEIRANVDDVIAAIKKVAGR